MPLMERERFDVVVSDILTLAPALAAEKAGLRRATLVPHVWPVHEPGLPFFGFGAMPPRTAVGRTVWRRALPVLIGGLERGREEMNESRAELGLEPTQRLHGGISEQLALVATFPQLEYPRAWPRNVHVTGPMWFELPFEDVELPEGDDPLVLVAPSTAQDPECKLVRVALEALADEPVRVLATTNRHLPTSSAASRAGERKGRRLAQLLAGDGRGRPRDHPRRARDGGASARRRSAGALLSRGRRHGRERRAGGVGGRRVDVAVAADGRGIAARGGPAAARGPVASRGRPSDPAWAEQNDGAGAGAELVEGLARSSTEGPAITAHSKLRGSDSNRQPIG